MSKIPDWAFSKALEACNIGHGAGKFGVETIARSLVAAERRGIERAADAGFRAAQHVNATADDIAAAIRQLAETDELPTPRKRMAHT